MKFENECWDHFKGETWKREINVRDFIQSNYTPYEGDDSFLVASSEKTRKVWNKLTEMFKVEREKGVYAPRQNYLKGSMYMARAILIRRMRLSLGYKPMLR